MQKAGLVGFSQLVQNTGKQRDCQVLGVSVDSQFTHLAWRKTPRENGGIGRVRFPLIADLDKSIARNYGVLHNDSVALRRLFLIDREGIVRHATVNDLPLGRNVDEALRMLDALRFHETRGDVCPQLHHQCITSTSKKDIREERDPLFFIFLYRQVFLVLFFIHGSLIPFRNRTDAEPDHQVHMESEVQQ